MNKRNKFLKIRYFKIIPIIVLVLFFGTPTVFATLSSEQIASPNNQSNTFFKTVFANTRELGENIFTKTSKIIKEIYGFRKKSKDSFKKGVFDGFGLTKEMLGNTTNSIFSLLDQRVGPTYFNVKEKSNTTSLQKTNIVSPTEYLSREEISGMIINQIDQAGLTGEIKNTAVENVGPRGPQGLIGETGPVGPRGLKGDKGEDGTSINSSDFVTWVSFENQIDRIYDSINEDNDSDDEDSSGSSSGHDEVTIGTANGLSLSDQVLSLGLSSTSTSGSLSSSDWNIFNNKQAALVSGTNIKTINGTSILGSGNIVISGGSGSMVYPEAGIPVSTGAAWGTSITDNSSNWNTAYGWGNHAGAGYLTGYTETDPIFSSWNKSTGISITKSQISDFGTYSTDIHANITALNAISGTNTGDETTSSIKTKLGISTLSGSNTGDQDLSGYSLTSHNHSGIYAPVLGTDDNYVTDAEKIIIGNTSGANTGDETTSSIKTKLGITTLSGSNTGDQDLSGYMTSSSFTDTAVTGKLLTGYVSGAGIISSSDTILQAIQKLNGNMVASGSGTVSSVSVTTANGVSAVITNPTTTPDFTFTLGAITPSSVGVDNLNLNGNTISSTSGGINLTPLSGQKLTITGNTDVTGDLVPTTNNTYNLGSATNYWHSMYVGPGSIYVDGQKVLQTDISDSVVVSSDDAQNLILKTSGGGNIELNPATGLTQGQVLLKGNVVLTGTKTFETSDNSAVIFADGISSPSFTTSVLNGGISITPNGTGNTYVTTGRFGIGNTSPAQALDVTGNILASGTILGSNLSGTNTGDETTSSIKTKLGISTLSGSNTGDQDLSGYSLTSHNHSGIYAPVLGTDDNYVTDAEKIIIGNTSGANTGDNAANSLYSGLASSKQNTLVSGTNIKTVGGVSLLGSGDLGTIGDSYLPTTLTGKTYNGVSLSTSAGSSSYLSGDGSYDSLTSSQWTTTGSNIYYNTGRVFIGASSEATSSAKLYLEGSTSSIDGPSSAITGVLGNYAFNPTGGGIQVGNRFVVTNSPTLVANTSVAEMIRTVDNTTLENLVRGIDVTSNAGSNTAGINTGIRGSGATFGVQGVTSALAGGTSVPAALYGESTGTTQGDVLRLYSKTMTSASSFGTFYHDTSAFTGTGLLMDFATGSGSFTGNFVDFQKNNTPLFRVTNGGVVVMGLSSTAATSAICSSLANGTSPTADTAYEIRDCSSIPVADYAEMYPMEKDAEYGDIMIVGNEMVNTYDTGSDGAIDWNKIKGTITKLVKSNKSYQSRVIGVVSDNYSDFSSVGYNIKDGDNPKPIAMNGRVPVKISPSSEEIKAGDYLTTSTDEGMAMKATRSGFVIGKALESWNSIDGKEMIMFFVEQGFYDSELEGEGLEEISVDGLVYENANKEFVDSIKFVGGVEFGIPPLFNNDTAGFAIIKAESDRVDIIFDKPYISSPVVNITVSFEEGDLSEEEIDEFFGNEIQSIVTNKTQSQFTIRINKKVTKDVRFSWVALAVRDPRVFESVIEGLQIDQDGAEQESDELENLADEQNIYFGETNAGGSALDASAPSNSDEEVGGAKGGENNSDENKESGSTTDDSSDEKVNTEINKTQPATSTDAESEKVSEGETGSAGVKNSGEAASSEGSTSSEAPAENSGGGDNGSSPSEQAAQ